MNLLSTLSLRLDETLLPLFAGTPDTICLLDAPDYPNVGDPAIMLGTTYFLRKHFPKTKIFLISKNIYNDSADSIIESSDALLLQGGGSFGDIWPSHHAFRMMILEKFGHKKLIQLSQSIHFKDPAVLDRSKRLLAGARDFTIVARDNVSFAFAQQSFDARTVLAPDMAFAMGPLKATPANTDYACLMRTDKEVLQDSCGDIRAILTQAQASFEISDWLENRWGLDKLHGVTRRAVRHGLSPGLLARYGSIVFEIYARSRLNHGISLLSSGRTVITDRLHGHILSTLLGRPRILFDSLDGKVRSFHDTWLSGDKNAVFLSNMEEFRNHIFETRAAA